MMLKELAALCGQQGAADDLRYHLSTRFAANKIPTLLLIPPKSDRDPSINGVGASMLVFEYRIFGIRSRVYGTSDTMGRRTVIGPAEQRAQLAGAACRSLMHLGAEIVLISLKDEIVGKIRGAFEYVPGSGKACGKWSLVERNAPLYLPLKKTFDETLATIGKKTRFNLRYYRRRAEKELGCTFVSHVSVTLEEFLKINLESAFPVEDEMARWRYESLKRIEDPLFCGIRDRDGRWLSLVSCRRSQGNVDLDWQINRADLPAYSLSTVLRSYLIEHEVARGSDRLYIDGTRSALQRSFVSERIADVTLCRRSATGWIMRQLAAWLLPERFQLTQVLRDRSIVWHVW